MLEVRHPAHVHHFKNFISAVQNRGHIVKLLAIEKEFTIYLLKKYNIPVINIGGGGNGLLKKFIGMIINDWKVYNVAKKFNPDIIMGRASPSLAHTSFFMRKPYISFSDTEHAKINYIFSFPFAKTVVTPSCFMKDLGKKNIRVNSYFELAYLHPNYFKPDSNILNLLGVEKNEKYVVMRFVSWKASHDIGYKGLSPEMKIKIVKELSKYVKVFISSEGTLPKDLKSYQVKIPPEKMHDVLAFATLFAGEGATMASECAMLGTPAIYVNTLTAGTLEEQERYGLIYNYRSSLGVIDKALELLEMPNLKERWQIKKQKMLSEKIDVTAFMVWFIENYPKSAKIMKKNPDYQFNFK